MGLIRLQHSLFFIAAMLMLGLLPANPAMAQDRRANEYYQQALQSMRSGQLLQGEELLLKALERSPNYRDASLALADLYRETGRLEQASSTYRQLLESTGPDYVLSYRWGMVLFELQQYDDAARELQRYLDSNEGGARGRAKARRFLENCTFAARALANPVPFDPINLGPAINTGDLEYFPAITADGKQLIFTRNESLGRTYAEDFFRSFKTDTGWSASERLPGAINTPLNEGALTVTADGKALFFTGCNRRDGRGSCDIYLSLWEGNRWGEPINLGAPINTNSWESQPSISGDGKTLYFASDRPGGIGGKDLWKSEYHGSGQWSEPVNLGDSINTPYDEMTPYIHWDQESFYFASDGHPGMGSTDLYRSTLHAGRFGGPVNLGYPINTAREENGLIVLPDGTAALFSRDESTEASRRNHDLYSFELPVSVRAQPIRYVEGNLLDAQNGSEISGRLLVVCLESGDTLMDSELSNGSFYLALQRSQEYTFTAISDGYFPYSQRFTFTSISDGEVAQQNLELYPLQSDAAVVLENVFFESGSYALDERSRFELEVLAAYLKSKPGMCFEISGHTDDVGTYADNLALSLNRARAVTDFLVNHGVPADALRAVGYADSQPRSEQKTPEGRALNRRTELKRCRP